MPIGPHHTQIGSHTPTGWWLEEAGEPAPSPPLEGSITADVVVIGGGYTGMWTAWELLERGASVALLEAGICGHGPSGRNGGFCESLWLSAAALRERFGDGPARALLDASSDAVLRVGAFCADEGVDAWFNQAGYMCVSTAPAFDDVGRASVEAAAALGAPERIFELSPGDVQARCASPRFRGGVCVPDFATLQPARLALGLRRRLIERGVRIYERTPMHRLRKGLRVETPGGEVSAGSAVLAIGPAARGQRGLRTRLSVTSSHIVLTEPVPDVIEQLGWDGECITDG
ncbi:MAG TPA: FAD-dependent oxidoreductase, partial [Thermoleophilaceae bacterium]|nr:FAD-dependent oxidoreductase [Thermoleophilaceae bacterium]